eukprot:364011-Chlamydomonas_euryale.AAC.4
MASPPPLSPLNVRTASTSAVSGVGAAAGRSSLEPSCMPWAHVCTRTGIMVSRDGCRPAHTARRQPHTAQSPPHTTRAVE